MKFTFTDTNQEILDELGKRVAGLRLSMNWSQQELSERSGVSKRSIERLEQGAGNLNLKAFIAICATLSRTPEFEALLPPVKLTPQQIFARQKLRKRAAGKRMKRVAKWGSEE